jgi:hypothetical protein
MYKLSLCFIFISFFSCSSQEKKEIKNNINKETNSIISDTIKLNNKRLKVSKISKLEYSNEIDYSEKTELINISRIDSAYTLQIKNGDKIVLKDSIGKYDDSDFIKYEFLGYFKRLGLYVFLKKELETSSHFIIDESNGNVFKIWGEPIFFKNSNFFITIADSLGYDVMPNGIQFCMFDNHNIKILYEYNVDNYIPKEIKINKDNSIYVKGLIPSYLSKNNLDSNLFLKIEVK